MVKNETECIFCKFATGEIKPSIIMETNNALATLDINPAGKLCGHALVMPKKHFENIYDCPDEELKELIVIVKKIASAVKEVSGAEGVNIIQNNGHAAGQFVRHLHFHVIPRIVGDGIRFDENRRKPKPLELTETAEELRKALKRSA